MRTVVLTTAIGMSVIGLSIAADSQAAIRRTEIPAQLLRPALQQLSKDRDLQLVFRTDVVGDLRTAGAVGDLTTDETLTQLLSGTGLMYRYLDEKTVTIVPRAEGADAARVPFGGAEREGDEGKSFWSRFQLAQATEGSAAVNERTAGSSSETPARRAQIEEVVVTAQKRLERLQDVPISVSVLHGKNLDRSTVQGVTEALNRVPGVTTTEARLSGGTNIVMRGVGAQAFINAGTSPIAYYLDSVPFGFVSQAITPDANAYDLERVEVLRGPQGTLYGANAAGGLVRVLTHDADVNKLEFKARTAFSDTQDGASSYRGDMATNVPIVEGKLAARAVVGYQDLGGWIDRPTGPDANDAVLRTYRLKLKAEPVEGLSMGLSAWRSRGDYEAPSLANDQNRVTSRPLREPYHTDYDVYGFDLSYDFPAFAVSSMTGYVDYSNDSTIDYTAFGSVNTVQFTTLDTRVFSQEIVLSSTAASAWKWTAGLFYRNEEDRSYAEIGAPNAGVPVVGFSYGSESAAIFGEVSRSFWNGKFEWTVGLRHFTDDVFNRKNFTTPPPYHIRNSFDSTTPRVVLAWRPHEDLTAYASYSEGFRSAVPVPYNIAASAPTLPPAGPDTLHNYELGAKGDLFGNLLSFEAAVYFIDWTNVQQIISVPIGGGFLAGALVNGESASGAGFDLALTVRPADGFELGLGLSWNDLSFDRDVFSGGRVLFAEGDRLALSAERTANISAEYFFALGGRLEGRLAASANYISSQTTRTQRQALVSDDMLISRASFSLEALDRRLTGTLFVDNANNWDGTVYLAYPGITDAYARVRPRTVGLQLEYRF